MPILKSPTCEECGDVIDADEDSVQVKIAVDQPLESPRTARVHLYLCLLTFRLKDARNTNRRN